jgi:hypothetical protein
MKDYIALVTVELHKFARQIAGGRPGRRRQRSLRGVGPMSAIGMVRRLRPNALRAKLR